LGLMVISVCLILLVFVGLAFVLIDKFWVVKGQIDDRQLVNFRWDSRGFAR
jgi:hypothetical protein